MTQSISNHRPRARVTARAIILHQNHVLFLEAKEPDRTWYFLPGGGVEHGEAVEEAVIREAYEETTIHVEPVRLLYVREFIAERHLNRSKNTPKGIHAMAFLFLCRPLQSDKEVQELGCFNADSDAAPGVVNLRWIALEEIAEHDIVPPHLKGALASEFPPPEGAINFWPEEDPRPE